jgi:nucleoid-associated protein YgaU
MTSILANHGRHAKPRHTLAKTLAVLVVAALIGVLLVMFTSCGGSAPTAPPGTASGATPTNPHPLFKVHVKPASSQRVAHHAHTIARTYTVRTGDSLWSIAVHHHTTWQRIYHMNRGEIGSNPNLIHTGEKLRI